MKQKLNIKNENNAMELTKEYEAAMYRFVYNCFSMCIYALLFVAIIYIGDFGLTTDKHFALSLILGFFAGLLNDIGRKIEFFNRDMLEEREADKVEPKFKVGDIIRLKGSAATYTIKRVTDTTYYTDGWSCGIERCEEDYELVEQNAAEKQGEKGTNGNNEEIPNSWSKEDMRKLNRIYSILGQAADTHAYSTTCRLIGDKECVELQDFLKERVQPQTKYEWCEEDEKTIDEAVECIEKYAEYTQGGNTKRYVLDLASRVESLVPQKQWTPSEEQMKQLGWIAEQNKDNMIGKELMSLYQDLKKLKG